MSNKQKKNTKTSKASKASVHESETSVGTELLREKVSQGTKKVFSRMLSRKKDPILPTGASSKTSLTSSSKISRKKSAEIINLDDTSMVDNDVDPTLSSLGSEKSADISNVVNVDPMMPSEKEKSAVSVFVPSGRGKSADIINIDAMMTSRKNSNESFSMSIDDEYDNLPSSPAGGHYFPLQSPKQVTEKEKSYVTSEEFNYTMNLLNSKVSALYKLCRYISDQQQGNSKSLEKLVALDELSDYFWNQACKDAAKRLLPNILFPSTSEYRTALEDYLKEHAPKFIDSIGENSWISLFEEKLLSEIKGKCRSKRNDIASTIRHQMFAAFGEEKLDRIDSTTSPLKIAEWKASEKTRVAYNELFSNHDLLSKIGYAVFKQHKDKELPTMHCAYILSICDILLNPKSSGIKCNDKSVARRVHAFLRAFENKQPVTQEIMNEIAVAEAKEAEEGKKNKQGSQGSQKEKFSEAGGSDDYDEFMNDLDSQFA